MECFTHAWDVCKWQRNLWRTDGQAGSEHYLRWVHSVAQLILNPQTANTWGKEAYELERFRTARPNRWTRRYRVCVHPAGQHLDGAVGVRWGDAEVKHWRNLEAEEFDAAEHARERAEHASVEEGLHAVRVPQELAAVDDILELGSLPLPRRQLCPVSLLPSPERSEGLGPWGTTLQRWGAERHA
jgi:hypothetical protein